MDLGLTGRAAIVTGASRGIGLAAARALCDEGANVLLVARGADGLDAAARACARRRGRPDVHVADVTEPAAAEEIVAACRAAFGTVDILVNNAGTTGIVPFDALDDAEWRAQWEVNVMAPMRLMRAAVPRMAERRWGRVVNVSSSSGKRPSQNYPAYSVAKAAQLSLSRVFADAHAAEGVTVNAVAPGPTLTSLWTDAGGLADQLAERQGTTREEALEAMGARSPRGEPGGEEEIAAVIVFLCSELAANVTGAAWSADGGLVASIV